MMLRIAKILKGRFDLRRKLVGELVENASLEIFVLLAWLSKTSNFVNISNILTVNDRCEYSEGFRHRLSAQSGRTLSFD